MREKMLQAATKARDHFLSISSQLEPAIVECDNRDHKLQDGMVSSRPVAKTTDHLTAKGPPIRNSLEPVHWLLVGHCPGSNAGRRGKYKNRSTDTETGRYCLVRLSAMAC